MSACDNTFTCTLDLCGGTPDGFIASTTVCADYILCVGGVTRSTHSCQPTLQFDHITKGCAVEARCYPGST